MKTDYHNECICSSYDARGLSVCGVECPAHPLDSKCPDCGSNIHGERRCFSCEFKWRKANIPKPCREMQKAYHHIMCAFQALKWWLKLEDRNPGTKDSKVDLDVQILRNMWKEDIIPWHIAENEHHNWIDPD